MTVRPSRAAAICDLEVLMGYKLAIFDLDGTILDTVGQLAVSFNEAMKMSGLEPLDVDIVKQRIGRGAINLVRACVGDIEEEKVMKIVQDYRDHYREHCTENTLPYDGIAQVFSELRAAGIKVAVVTNKSDAPANILCDAKFPGLIDKVKGHREGLKHKPDPFLVNELLSEFKISPDEAVFIGDSDVDILTAQNAGIDPVSVTWGYKSREFLISCGARRLADAPNELPGMII